MDWQENSVLFDFSDYPKQHHLFSDMNKKVIAKMKDETASVPISEFVGLRSKMYSIKYGSQEKKTAKGISKYVVKQKMRHAKYKSCLLNQTVSVEQVNLIRSSKHQIFSICVNKQGLSPYDDKRYVLSNGCDTLAHGHCKICF